DDRDQRLSSVPRFSVVIPTIGRPELADAVRSVLTQTIGDLECIVVDDVGAPLPVLPADPRLRVIQRDMPGGPSAARTPGVNAARGRYLACRDDDDSWTPDRLEIACEGLAQAPVTVCLSTHTRDGQLRGGALGRSRGRVLNGDISTTIREGNVPQLGRTAL